MDEGGGGGLSVVLGGGAMSTLSCVRAPVLPCKQEHAGPSRLWVAKDNVKRHDGVKFVLEGRRWCWGGVG